MVSLFGRGFESHQLHPIKTKSRSIRAAFLLSVCSNGFGMPGSQYGYNHHRVLKRNHCKNASFQNKASLHSKEVLFTGQRSLVLNAKKPCF